MRLNLGAWFFSGAWRLVIGAFQPELIPPNTARNLLFQSVSEFGMNPRRFHFWTILFRFSPLAGGIHGSRACAGSQTETILS